VVVFVTTADGAVNSENQFELEERGAYTVLLGHDGSQTLIQDAPGRYRYTAIFVAAACLIAMGIGHWLVGRVILRYPYLSKLAAGDGAALHPSKPREVTFWSFFGYDTLVVTHRQKEAAAKMTDEAESATGTSINRSIVGYDKVSASDGAPSTPLLSSSGGTGNGDDASDGMKGASVGGVAAPAVAVTTKPSTSGRVNAIDTVRGICLSIMVRCS
jgi:hypothetical protein